MLPELPKGVELPIRRIYNQYLGIEKLSSKNDVGIDLTFAANLLNTVYSPKEWKSQPDSSGFWWMLMMPDRELTIAEVNLDAHYPIEIISSDDIFELHQFEGSLWQKIEQPTLPNLPEKSHV